MAFLKLFVVLLLSRVGAVGLVTSAIGAVVPQAVAHGPAAVDALAAVRDELRVIDAHHGFLIVSSGGRPAGQAGTFHPDGVVGAPDVRMVWAGHGYVVRLPGVLEEPIGSETFEMEASVSAVVVAGTAQGSPYRTVALTIKAAD